jgi:hypothetical protein
MTSNTARNFSHQPAPYDQQQSAFFNGLLTSGRAAIADRPTHTLADPPLTEQLLLPPSASPQRFCSVFQDRQSSPMGILISGAFQQSISR